MNLTNPECPPTKTPVRTALEDAGVIFAYTLIPMLIVIGATGLSLDVLYIPFLSAGLIGVSTYARMRNIDVRPPGA